MTTEEAHRFIGAENIVDSLMRVKGKKTITNKEYVEAANVYIQERRDGLKNRRGTDINAKENQEMLDSIYPFLESEEIAENLLKELSKKYGYEDFEYVDGEFRRINYKPLKFILEVPSGFIVADDWLSILSKHDGLNNTEFNINTTKGIIERMTHFNKNKVAHGFVGNSCPSLLWNNKENELHIGAELERIYEDYPEAVEEEDFEFGDPINKELKMVGNICTDLWWYSIMDKDEFVNIGGDIDSVGNLIEVPAGTYEFEHFYGVSERGWDIECYAIARKIK